MKIIIHTGVDGDYILAARAVYKLLSHPEFKTSGVTIVEDRAFYVCRNKSGSITARCNPAWQDDHAATELAS